MSAPTLRRRACHFDRILIGNRWERDVRLEVGEAGRIAAVEPGGDPEGCERVGGWTLPGIPNVHSHSFQRALAGLAEGGGPDSFWSWRNVMYAFLEHLTPDDVGAITAQLHVEMLKTGFTCVGEFHYLHHAPGGAVYDDPAEISRRILAAARRTGIGLVHMPVVYEVGGFDGEPLEGGQKRFRMTLDEVARLREGLRGDAAEAGIQLGWALHSLRAVSGETFGRLAEFVSGGGSGDISRAPVHLHIAEQQREVRECIARRGSPPVEWLTDNAPVDERWCLVHATHATDFEMERVAGAGAVVGLCPTTEANLGDGFFPLGAFAAEGGRFGIGTDSHVSRSPIDELRLLDYGQRLKSGSRWVLGAARAMVKDDVLSSAGGALLAHAWRDGCRALAWNGGSVRCGMRADLLVLDADHPSLAGRSGHNVLDSWVFSGTDSPVRDVMVGGSWVVRDGRHEHEEEVGREFERAVKRLAERQ